MFMNTRGYDRRFLFETDSSTRRITSIKAVGHGKPVVSRPFHSKEKSPLLRQGSGLLRVTGEGYVITRRSKHVIVTDIFRGTFGHQFAHLEGTTNGSIQQCLIRNLPCQRKIYLSRLRHSTPDATREEVSSFL